MVAARLANMRQGERTDLPSIEGRLSQIEASRLLNVGIASVERAKQVQAAGTEPLRQAVDTGSVSVSAAAEIATLPEQVSNWLEKQGGCGTQAGWRGTELVSVAADNRGLLKEAVEDLGSVEDLDPDQVAGFIKFNVDTGDRLFKTVLLTFGEQEVKHVAGRAVADLLSDFCVHGFHCRLHLPDSILFCFWFCCKGWMVIASTSSPCFL